MAMQSSCSAIAWQQQHMPHQALHHAAEAVAVGTTHPFHSPSNLPSICQEDPCICAAAKGAAVQAGRGEIGGDAGGPNLTMHFLSSDNGNPVIAARVKGAAAQAGHDRAGGGEAGGRGAWRQG